MSAQPISSSSSTPVPYTPPAPKRQNAAAAATEESTETADATRQEAAHGDQVAIRKLAKLDQAKTPAPAPKTTGGAQGGLNVLA
jgi:hypothetical protein